MNQGIDTRPYREILERVGNVLIVVGLLDIIDMVRCIANHQSYHSSLNIFAVIAGVYLRRADLRAAVKVRTYGYFAMGAWVSLLVGGPLIQPLGLMVAQFHQGPGSIIFSIALTLLDLGVGYWVLTELGQETVRTAARSAGVNWGSKGIPAIFGVVLTFVLLMVNLFMLRGPDADHAITLAQKQVGPGFSYHVTHLRTSTIDGRKSVSADVTAWNSTTIKEVPVSWTER